MPATTDYWVNDQSGDPLFVMTAVANAGMVKMLPEVLAEVRQLVGDRRITIVFDRGGWSPKLFEKLLAANFDILTYRKGKCRRVGVARGTQTRESVEALHGHLMVRLPLDEIVVCYHDRDTCNCRRPKPGALLEAGRRLGVALARSFVVGNRWRDVEAGQRVGCIRLRLQQNGYWRNVYENHCGT